MIQYLPAELQASAALVLVLAALALVVWANRRRRDHQHRQRDQLTVELRVDTARWDEQIRRAQDKLGGRDRRG